MFQFRTYFTGAQSKSNCIMFKKFRNAMNIHKKWGLRAGGRIIGPRAGGWINLIASFFTV